MANQKARLATLGLAAALAASGSAAGAQTSAASLSSAYGSFGFSLFHALAKADPGENVVLSPASVAIALAMASNGAAGSTRAAMLRVLGTTGMSQSAFDSQNAALLKALREPGGSISFSVANALWLNEKAGILPAFVKRTQSVFGATAQNVAFGDPSAAQTINAWVEKNTSGLIAKIVDQTEPADVAILTNAMALKAKWMDPFEKSATHDAEFHLPGGKTATVSMMHSAGSLQYAKTGQWEIARLPYEGDRFAMYVLLPQEGVDLQAAAASLDVASFEADIAKLQPQGAVFEMPRYTATFGARLNGPLSAMGMGIAFTPDADFSAMASPALHVAISAVEHRAYVRVDEEGTQAAAATAVVMRTMAIMMPQIKMIVNRPFLMAIRDDRTRQILFLGAIADPRS